MPRSPLRIAIAAACVGTACWLAVATSSDDDGANSAREASPKDAPGQVFRLPNGPPISSSDVDGPMLEDLNDIAELEGITLDEAVARYGWQNEFSDVVARIETAHPTTFVSAEINAEPLAPGAVIRFSAAAPTGIQDEVAALVEDLPAPVTVEIG